MTNCCCTFSVNDLAALEAEVLTCIRSSSTLLAPHSWNSLGLPVELWSTVWLHLPFSGRVAASQTCRQWRLNALACQELWADICVHVWVCRFYECATCDDKLDDERISARQIAPTRLAHLLERSGKRHVSLTVIMHGPSDQPKCRVIKAVAQGLISHARRVRSLDIHASDNAGIPIFMLQLPKLRNLRRLKASSSDLLHSGFLLEGALDAPRLKHVVVGGTILGLAKTNAVGTIGFPSMKTLQCTVSSAQALVNVVRIAATGALKSFHLCLSCDTEEGFMPSYTERSLVCSLLAEMPLSSITLANLWYEDRQLMEVFALPKVKRITFQSVPGSPGFDGGFVAVLNSIHAPNKLLFSRVEGVDGGGTAETRRKGLQWSTFSFIDTNWHTTQVPRTARRRDLHWDMGHLQRLHNIWDGLPNSTYQSLRLMTIDSDLLHIFHRTGQITLTWPNVHTVTVQVVPEELRLASPADALPMLDLPALTTLNIEASLTQDIIWLDIEVFRHSIMLPILGDRTVKLMLFTGVTLHSTEVPVQSSELAGNAEVVRFE